MTSIGRNDSIYSSRLYNVPAPAGYGVTIPQDLAPYFAMGDRFYTTNFAQQTQYNLYPDGYDPLTYYLAQNPQLAQTNPMLRGIIDNGQPSSLRDIAATRLSQQAPQTLASLEAQLQEALNSDRLTADQKNRVQEKLNQVRQLKQAFQQALSNPAAQVRDLYALENAMTALQGEVAQLGQTLAQEIQQAQQAQQAQQSAEQSQQNPDVSLEEIPDTVDADNAEALKEEVEKLQNLSVDICKNIYDGTCGCTGTEYDTIKKGTDRITKDNVAFVLTTWNAQYKDLAGDKNGMIETLFAEEMGWNPSLSKRNADNRIENPKNNMDIIWNIVRALEDKAKELKIYNQLSGQFAVAYDELDDTFVNQSKVETAVNTITEAVFKAQQEDMVAKAAEKTKDAKKADETSKKEEAERKQAEQAQEAKNLFLTDMREIWEDETAEISEKVQYKDGKFTIRIMGKDYSGRDFNELVKVVRDAGFDPEQYLKKQPLRVAA